MFRQKLTHSLHQCIITYKMTTVSKQLTIADPMCCYTRASKRKNPEIDILDMGLYALYTLIMLSISFMLKNLLGVYICSTFLVIILTNIYTLRNMINDNESLTDIDESIYSDVSTSVSDSESEEGEAEDSILEDFKKIVDEASEETAISKALDTATAILEQKSIEYKLALSSAEAAAADYNRVAREYSEIEKIIQGVAAEYRSKAAAAKEAALAAIIAATEGNTETDADADDAEARADAADEKEYNAD